MLSRRSVATIVIVFFLGPTIAQSQILLEGVQLLGRGEDEYIAVVAEENSLVPELLLWRLKESAVVGLKIVDGPAQFIWRGKAVNEVEFRSGIVRLPIILTGGAFRNSMIEVRVNGEIAADLIRIGAVEEGRVADSLDMPEMQRMVIYEHPGKRFVVIDESLMVPVVGQQELGPGGWEGHGPRPWCPQETWENPFVGYAAEPNCSGFNLNPWGIVEWINLNPLSKGYSVKPEFSNQLIYGQAPWQLVDGVYRNSWGCGIAVKIPNLCKMKIYPGISNCCCNAISTAAGKVCEFVNPGAIGWSNCPLP